MGSMLQSLVKYDISQCTDKEVKASLNVCKATLEKLSLFTGVLDKASESSKTPLI
jgi:hypothetical protein